MKINIGGFCDLFKKLDPISKITRAKRAGGVAQAVEPLPSKHEALNSSPSTTKKIVEAAVDGSRSDPTVQSLSPQQHATVGN
jgi:hypothetical protein